MAEKEGLPAYCFGGIVSWHTIRIIPIIYFALVWVLAIKSTTALFSQFNFSSDWWMGRLIYPSLSLIFVYLSCFPMFVAPLFFLSLFLFNFSLSLFLLLPPPLLSNPLSPVPSSYLPNHSGPCKISPASFVHVYSRRRQPYTIKTFNDNHYT